MPYGDYPLGEGSGVEPQPRWRVDQVDCQTFVETVLAMADGFRGPVGQGRFRWSVGEGSELVWSTVWRGDADRIWYGEGHARPSPLLPMVPVRVVAVLHYPRLRDRFGVVRVTHEVDVYLQTDSKAAALVTRLIGPAVPRLAEQGANQLLMFFSSLTRYCELHPEDVEGLFAKQ